jgi:hypothetical protein
MGKSNFDELGQKIEKNASKLGVVSFNPNKIIFRGFLTPGKFFQNFSMRAIDSSHKITPKNDFVGVNNPFLTPALARIQKSGQAVRP